MTLISKPFILNSFASEKNVLTNMGLSGSSAPVPG